MASLRGITQKSVPFFINQAAQGAFNLHNVHNGVSNDDSQDSSEAPVEANEDKTEGNWTLG